MEIPIFYDARQSVEGLNTYSPSAGKPARFIKAMTTRHGELKLQPVTPVTRDDLLLAHAKHHVDGIFNLTILNGFENNDPRVPESCLWTCGSLATAALHAHEYDTAVCSPTSGFHHAGYAWSGGYCTFNGLVVAAAKFIAANPGKKVAILDLDWHYSDGTVDVLKHKPELAKGILNITSGKHFYGEEQSYDFFAWLQKSIREINEFKPDLVLYQAGADMSKYDPLGGLLTDTEMAHRDRLVFTLLPTPIVFCLAGGYREIHGELDPVIDIHRRTLEIANSIHRKNYDSILHQQIPTS